MRSASYTIRGFTLLELMIGLAVISILSTIAYPLYTSHVRKGHRSAAQTALMELAARQASWRSRHTRYGDIGDILGLSPSIADPSSRHYSFSVTATATTFTLSAVPQAGQAADDCGTLSMSQNLTGSPSNCW